jgi:hypothetical protein
VPCTKCLFHNRAFEQGGGEYRVVDSFLPGTPTRIRKGAALHTLTASRFLGDRPKPLTAEIRQAIWKSLDSHQAQ